MTYTNNKLNSPTVSYYSSLVPGYVRCFKYCANSDQAVSNQIAQILFALIMGFHVPAKIELCFGPKTIAVYTDNEKAFLLDSLDLCHPVALFVPILFRLFYCS